MKILFEHLLHHRVQIIDWFDTEKVEKISFYNNFMYREFTEDNFVCLVNDADEPIGYIDYTITKYTAKINVAMVKKTERKKGYAQLLLNELIKKLIQNGVVVLSLDCVPATTKKVWKKMGFKEFKEIENHKLLKYSNYKKPWLYKILVDTEKPTKKQKLNSYLELWTVDEQQAKELKPSYRWDLQSQTKPIIYPVDGNWKVNYVENGTVMEDYKIKNLHKGKIIEDYFLILK